MSQLDGVPFDDFGQFAMQDFAFHSPAAQPGRYFEGGGKRVLHTVCQDDGRAGKSLEMLDNQPFHSAGGDEQDAEIVGRQLVDILVIYEIDGEIFFQFVQDYFMGTAD